MTIEDVAWYIETIAPDRWSDSVVDKPSLSYSFEVYFAEMLDSSDIKTARVYLPNSSSYWDLDPDTTLDTVRNSVGYGVRYWLTANNDELPIGSLRAEIVLNNGTSSQYTFIMGKPGSVSPSSYAWVYSAQEVATPTYPSTSTEALRRPTVTTLSFENGQLKTTFRIRGNNVRNGWIWYYDAGNQYVGRSPYFYNQKLDIGTATFSKGWFDSQADAENVLICNPNEIIKTNGSGCSLSEMNTISHCRLYVTDGAQYTGDGVVQYDYRAMSEYF